MYIQFIVEIATHSFYILGVFRLFGSPPHDLYASANLCVYASKQLPSLYIALEDKLILVLSGAGQMLMEPLVNTTKVNIR